MLKPLPNTSRLAVAVLLACSSAVLAAPQTKPKAKPQAKAIDKLIAKPKPQIKTIDRLQRQMVGGVDVSGLDAAGRARRLRRVLNRKLNAKIVLAGGARKVSASRRSLGVELDIGWMQAHAARGDMNVPLKLQVNLKKAIPAMKRLAPRFALGKREARIVNRRRGMQIIPEVVGQKLNPGGSAMRLAQAIERRASDQRVSLLVRKQVPRRTRASFKGINGRLSTFSTEYNPDKKGRTYNMMLASRAIDGTIVKPGATFSLNGTVGERTKARGYQSAIIFEDQKKKQGLGGGVSQITGTLFNAALLAGLPIVSYQTHSRPVAYIPIGRDATVSWGDFDMKFRNNTGAPLFITYTVKSGTATASIFGKRKPGQKVGLSVVSKKLGPRHIIANLYRTIRVKNKVVSKAKVGDSDYSWKPDKGD